jgi:hypothetical protein
VTTCHGSHKGAQCRNRSKAILPTSRCKLNWQETAPVEATYRDQSQALTNTTTTPLPSRVRLTRCCSGVRGMNPTSLTSVMPSPGTLCDCKQVARVLNVQGELGVTPPWIQPQRRCSDFQLELDAASTSYPRQRANSQLMLGHPQVSENGVVARTKKMENRKHSKRTLNLAILHACSLQSRPHE